MFFFFNDTATTEIYPLSLHDALPIWRRGVDALHDGGHLSSMGAGAEDEKITHALSPFLALPARHLRPYEPGTPLLAQDRKSTRLNSSHLVISYAVFCLKKKKKLGDTRNQQPCRDGRGLSLVQHNQENVQSGATDTAVAE